MAVMRLSNLEVDATRREEEHILKCFGLTRTDKEEVVQLAVVARCSDPYVYLDDSYDDEEEEEREDNDEKDGEKDDNANDRCYYAHQTNMLALIKYL